MNLEEIIFKRRTIRRFKQDPISLDILKKLVDFARVAPMAKNVKDARILLEVIQGKDQCDSISREGKGKVINGKGKPVIGLLDLKGLKVDSRIIDLINGKIMETAKKNKWQVKEGPDT